ncbi:hypothetical protein GCM10023226_41220 [Nocardioides nanhaiensis]|uniref:DUF3955 domain-containing protein n=1 Tax=Nocardioides nanhaiensis TaxID=1476871 RepID=A0ABP8X379_9ACTN
MDPTVVSRPALALASYLGTALLVGGVLCFVAAFVNHDAFRNTFYDDLGNEAVIGSSTTLLLVVLGLLLVLHGAVLLLWRAASRPRRT